MEEQSFVYEKIKRIIMEDRQRRANRSEVCSNLVTKFRLNKEEMDSILKNLEKNNVISMNRISIRLKPKR
jgi:hypothetical protein